MINKKTTLIITIVAIMVLIVSSTSYAYFTAEIGDGESASTLMVEGATLEITYNDSNPKINIANAYPKDDALATKTFTLSGTNTSDLEMFYKVSLVVEANTYSDDTLTYTLDSENTSDNGTIINAITTPTGIKNGANNISLGIGKFVKGADKVHTYTLKIFFLNKAESQNNEQTKSLNAYIKIEDTNPTLMNITNGDNVVVGSTSNQSLLLSKIRNNNFVEEPLTVPGQAASLENESVLSTTTDDYGTSYYFRGNVQNNYVSFAGMCWRVVRITGNGAIKLVLYNYNPNSVSNPCNASEDGTSNAFARFDGENYLSPFNTLNDQNASIGFMYGTPGSSSYSAEHDNANKSTILTNLETWYNAKLSSYASKLADTIWCNDKNTKSVYTVDNEPFGNGLGYGTNQTMYGARDRLYANGKYAQAANPSLICPNDDNGGNLSKYTADDVTSGNGVLDYKIGLLTADEVAFAGGIFENENSSYYLNSNATINHWWLISPHRYNGTYGSEWLIYSTGNMRSGNVGSAYGLRPSISLVNSITSTSGVGTQSDPYVVD